MNDIAVVLSNENENTNAFETLDSIVKAKFNKIFIQWYDSPWKISQEEQVKEARKNNLEIIFAHLGYQNIEDIWKNEETSIVERYKKNIKECKNNNINLVVMHLSSFYEKNEITEIGLSRLKEIIDYAKEQNVKIAFENTKNTNIKEQLTFIINYFNEDHVGICFDTGHFHAFQPDYLDPKIFKDKIFAVHIHDNDQSADQHLLPFDGTINWEFILNLLNQCNYNGPITMELCYRRNYLTTKQDNFYKQGYEVGIKLDNMRR